MTNKKNDNAFPQDPKSFDYGPRGLTKYEYFFAAAITGFCADPKLTPSDVVNAAERVAKLAMKKLEIEP